MGRPPLLPFPLCLSLLALSACSVRYDYSDCETAEDCLGAAACSDGICQVDRVAGDVTADQTWGAGQVHVLDGLVFVAPGVTLTVAAGARVLGQPGSALVVRPGGQLVAEGRADAPVVFTSAAPEGSRRPGDWGGVSLLGEAPVNRPLRLEGLPEGTDAPFGGADPEGSCGRLTYVRVEFAGRVEARDDELNGLTLAGCGAGTVVSHVQVHQALDDGLALFGGTVAVDHVLITRPGDDGLDWDAGWQGEAQFVAVQLDSRGDACVEGDSHPGDPDAAPRSAPALSNLTLVGSPSATTVGLALRAGTAATLVNGVVVGTHGGAVDVVDGDGAVARQLADGTLSLHGFTVYDAGPTGFPDESAPEDDDDLGLDEARTFATGEWAVTLGEDPALGQPFRLSAPGLRPAVTLPGEPPPAGAVFDASARHRGAFEGQAGGGRDWTEGWTAFPAD
ncbi:MAG: hypothetical protein KC613_23055 [Myxococcales bacterium]|nr:hypothetical protein [Myxococcales bacterium]MCB9524301.1 hypothetical protein [Myxococcales bacterium]